MDNKYIIDTKENKEYLDSLRDELLDFGKNVASPTGGSYYLGDDGTPWDDRPRETWITCRMVHAFSMGAMLNHPGSLEIAQKSLNGLLTELKDTKNGGWYSGINPDGTYLPLKMCYAHAFVILAGSSALLAGLEGAQELLDEAKSVYDEKFWDEEEGMSCDLWNTEFTQRDTYRGLNANMHTVEAFLACANATNDPTYRKRAGRIIDHVVSWASNNNWRIPEHFNDSWVADLECNKDKPDDQFKPYGATCGHGIEWSRLIVEWALSTYMPDSDDYMTPGEIKGLKESGAYKYVEAAENLFNRAIADGWNSDGAKGIVYTTDWNGKPIVHDRMHWTLMEAINTSSVLYRVTGKQKYADNYSEFLEYMADKVHDDKYGSFYHQLDEKNNFKDTVWPGKSDIYHSIQAMMIPYYKPSLSIASAVKATV